ncbi:unnamed protein product [Polarella glacialis]|uniref:Uncharacterized protein n=1 Tax=Polarella glacialis TaxID=89957 RepID=A0A813L0K3_POLGL|nr:unnamed protein product [Polarella glacialis]
MEKHLLSVLDSRAKQPSALSLKPLFMADASIQVDIAEDDEVESNMLMAKLDSAEEVAVFVCIAIESFNEHVLAPAKSDISQFYLQFGWQSADEYFDTLGEAQIMLVDVDHNDRDDRFAIVLLAYQMASAAAASALKQRTCTLYLDGRSYENSDANMIKETRNLAYTLDEQLRCHGLHVMTTFSKGPKNNKNNSWAQEVSKGSAKVSVWLLSAICKPQLEDFAVLLGLDSKLQVNVFEQSQPAWQPPAFSTTADSPTKKAEPSNIRSGEGTYESNIQNYLSFQRLLVASSIAGSSSVAYFAPALGRAAGPLPVVPGMAPASLVARPFTVRVAKASDAKQPADFASERNLVSTGTGLGAYAAARLQAAMADFVKGTISGPLQSILSLTVADANIAGLEPILKYGTYMTDAIVVALFSRREFHQDCGERLVPVIRRLAFASLSPEGGCTCTCS